MRVALQSFRDARCGNSCRTEGAGAGCFEFFCVDAAGSAEGFQEGVGVGNRVRFAEAHTHVGVVDPQDVDSGFAGGGDCRVSVRHAHSNRVEEAFRHRFEVGVELVGERCGQAVDAAGDLRKTNGTVVDGVHGCDIGQQRLGGADVRGGLFAADVLFAGLQGQAVAGLAVSVLRHTHQAAGDLPLELFGHGHEAGVRTAEEQRNAEALSRADGNVGTLLGGGAQHRQSKEVTREGDHCGTLLGTSYGVGEVAHGTRGARLRTDDAEHVFADQALGQVSDLHLEVHGLGAGADDRDGLRVQFGVENNRGALFVGSAHEQHGLCDRGGFVQQRGVGDVEAGEVLNHLLEVEQTLEPALRDFRLVGRVGGVPGGVFHQVAADDGRGDRVVVAAADHLRLLHVLRGEFTQVGEHFDFRQSGRGLHTVVLDVLRNCGARQSFKGIEADRFKHGGGFVSARADVAVSERALGVTGEGGDVGQSCGNGFRGSGAVLESHRRSLGRSLAGQLAQLRLPPRSVAVRSRTECNPTAVSELPPLSSTGPESFPGRELHLRRRRDGFAWALPKSVMTAISVSHDT